MRSRQSLQQIVPLGSRARAPTPRNFLLLHAISQCSLGSVCRDNLCPPSKTARRFSLTEFGPRQRQRSYEANAKVHSAFQLYTILHIPVQSTSPTFIGGDDPSSSQDAHARARGNSVEAPERREPKQLLLAFGSGPRRESSTRPTNEVCNARCLQGLRSICQRRQFEEAALRPLKYHADCASGSSNTSPMPSSNLNQVPKEIRGEGNTPGLTSECTFAERASPIAARHPLCPKVCRDALWSSNPLGRQTSTRGLKPCARSNPQRRSNN